MLGKSPRKGLKRLPHGGVAREALLDRRQHGGDGSQAALEAQVGGDQGLLLHLLREVVELNQ